MMFQWRNQIRQWQQVLEENTNSVIEKAPILYQEFLNISLAYFFAKQVPEGESKIYQWLT